MTDSGTKPDDDETGSVFRCRVCDHEKEMWSWLTGSVHVILHYYRQHPEKCVKWGDPRNDIDPRERGDSDE